MFTFMKCICLLVLLQGANGRAFLGANPELQAAAVRQELQGVLSEVLGAGHGVDSKELSKIKAFLSPMFLALPKNLQGHVSAPVMRYIVQRYFSGRYGWIIRGFEPHAQTTNMSNVSDGDGAGHILQSKLPEYVRSALEEKFAHNGFALDDTAMMVAAVERLAFDEVIRGVETSYYLNELQTTSSLSHAMLLETLSSYLIIEMLEGKFDNIDVHKDDKIHVREIYPNWDEAFVFTQDVVKNDRYERMDRQNPFVDHDVFMFEDVTRIAQRLSNDFGPASNHECTNIKDRLAAMDVHATGRVKLSDFYGKTHSQDANEWEFGESVDYLRSLGALDESDSLFGPQVIIPNYVSGLSNCVTSAAYYSICCVNECEKVFQHLEKDISGPFASAEEILQSLNAMPTPESNLNTQVRQRLEELAAYHNGKVPLHGRLFAQWLHYAFPRDCPYPHVAGTVNPETPLRWEDTGGVDSTIATQDEVERYIQSESARIAPSPDAGAGMWSLHETLLEASTPSDKDESSLRKVLRSIASFGMLGGLVLMLKNFMPQVQDVVAPRKSVEYDV
jgi:hypothetical protein